MFSPFTWKKVIEGMCSFIRWRESTRLESPGFVFAPEYVWCACVYVGL